MASVVTLFYSRLREEAHGYDELAAEVEGRARRAPGFLSFKSFTAEDGERLSVAMFDSAENQAAWRDDVAHREAQERGRAEFYSEYEVVVGEVTHRRRST